MGNGDKQVMSVGAAGEPEILSVQRPPQIEKNIDEIVGQAEKQLEMFKKILGIAIKRTNPGDWTNMGSKPYLTASGCEKVAPLFRVSVKGVSDEKRWEEDDKGSYYIYILKGTFSWSGGSIEAIGTCTSRDQFFAKKGGEWRELSDIDESNILKAAYSNLMVNGVTRLLGIRNLTWEELKPYSITPDNVAKVDYKNGSEGGTTKDEAEGQTKLYRMVMHLAGGDQDTAQDIIEENTTFKGRDGKQVKGVRSIKILKGKRLQVIYGKVEKLLKENGFTEDQIEKIKKGEFKNANKV